MDIQYLLALQKIRDMFGGVLDSFMLHVTTLGEQTITFLVLAFIYWCVDKHAGQLMAMNVSVACTWNQFIKGIFKIKRPWVRDEGIMPVPEALPTAGGYSFPSGHAQRATAVWGSLGVFLWERREKAVSILCWIIVAVVIFSRNYLGVHTPQDVAAAVISGSAIILVIKKVLNWVEGRKGRDLAVAGLGCMLCFLPVIKSGWLSNAGAGIGFFLGWILERRFVNFDIKDTWGCKCIRFGVGGMGILFILTVLPGMLGLGLETGYAAFLTRFILATFIMALYPFFFCERARYKAGIITAAACLVCGAFFSISQIRSQVSVDNIAEIENVDMIAEDEEIMVNEEPQQVDGVTLPEIIAHRGYSSVFPENTMAAFAGALDIGTDYIELDVQLTRDGQVVIFHDDSLERITGAEGKVSDYTLEELSQMDAGRWFSPSYEGERIPTLWEALELISRSECRVYLELKDIGPVDGFEEKVLSVVRQCEMEDRCVFASFRYEYLAHIKELDPELLVLYNTTSCKNSLPEEYPADYYGLYVESIREETVNAIHQKGKQAFVWTVNTPIQIKNVQNMGIDGIVTNYPGLAKVIRQPEYGYLAEHYERSITMPGLYGADIPEMCKDMIVQGMTRAGNKVVVSAYSRSGEHNSILYIMNLNGELQNIVDLGFKAHTGGIAYDEDHELLWVTGPAGMVYAVSWTDIADGFYEGDIKVSFDGGLTNHNGSKVASFLTYFEGELFVGSYVDGNQGMLNRYDLTDIQTPWLLSSAAIPQRIQGITFKRDLSTGICYMFLSQGYQTEDSCLIKYLYDSQVSVYEEPLEMHVLPEGVEQIQMAAGGMYILFESAVRPYRATARIPNDQIYIVRE